MIAPVGTRIGVRHTTGEWIPAVVVGAHWTGATLVITVPDPEFVRRCERQGFTVSGCQLAIPPAYAMATGSESTNYWQHAKACVFRRKCESCKGFGCVLVDMPSVVAAFTGEREQQERTCGHCDGRGWHAYDPWECCETSTTGDVAASAQAAAYGNPAV